MSRSLLDGRSLSQRLKDAEDFLLLHGYSVRPPLTKKTKVETPSQLVRFFYDTMAAYNPQFKMVYAGSAARDRATAKRLIESRIAVGSSRERALIECCELITILFAREEWLRLDFTVTSMAILGQDKMGWVTEKLWQMHEGLHRQLNMDEEAEWWDSLYKNQEETVNEDELNEARSRLDRILDRHAKEKEDS